MLRQTIRFLAFLVATIAVALAAATLTHHATLALAPAGVSADIPAPIGYSPEAGSGVPPIV